MGKNIEEKYKDVNHRILKKSLKKDKPSEISTDLTRKRKLPSIEDNDQPNTKLAKIENVHIEEQPKTYQLQEIASQNQNEISSYKIHVVQSCDSLRLEIKESKSRDLFLQDELSNSYENFTNDLAFQILDEISLEGLDGITIEAFWKRFSLGMERMTYISDDIKQAIWRFICSKKDIQFFKLREPRGTLEIYDRSKYLDAEIGVVVELPYELPDIYPHELVNHPDVQGSCSTFDTRRDVFRKVRNLDLKTAEKQYGTSLVMVANQRLRRKALFCESADPTAELVNMEYCILERIGRSRKHGELTQGNMSVGSHFKMDPKSMFHYKKQLIRYKLIAKQFFYIKSAVVDQNKTGKLLHLKRFYHTIKPKQMILVEQIVNVIRERPDCRIECSELRKLFQEFAQQISKITKSPEFRKYVKMEFVCYRDIYPNATPSEYMRKSKPIEKFIKCLELINPFVNITATWSTESDDSDDEVEEEEEGTGGKMFNMECFREVYNYILSKGRDGCTLHEIKKLMDIDSNTVRMCLKKLLTSNTVTVKKFDQGKQRYLLYYANTGESETDEINVTPDAPKPINDILAKFKDRKRKILEKLKQPPAGKSDLRVKNQERKCKCEVKVPQLTCWFFIRDIPQLLYSIRDTFAGIDFIYKEETYRIRINTDFPKRERSFEINEALSKISPEIASTTVRININFDMAYNSRTNINYTTKLILLKAAFGDAVINANTLNCFTRKRKRTDIPVLSDMEKEKPKIGNDKLQYMGTAPVTVFSEKEGDIDVEIVVSTPPAKFKNNCVYPGNRELSERVISRIGIILRTIYEKKVFEEVFKLIKVIEEEELKEGYTNKIDRKSLARILKRLIQEGYIKIFKLSISDDRTTKIQTFVCVPSIAHTNSLIQSACQQLKWKYFIGDEKKALKTNVPLFQKNLEEKFQQTASPFKQSDVLTSITQIKDLNKSQRTEITYKPSRQAGRTYGFKPKFIRMRIIHEFLYYLIYDYDRTTQPLKEREVEGLFDSYHIKVTKENLKQIPNVYCREISWKMFIPPLPHHKGWVTGWSLMCDVILRLPISVLCKIHNVGFDMPDLMDILNHPIKRFYLVKDLPETVRVSVLHKRKYLFDMHETICRLAWCGLVQFGPHKFKEKDQVFIYLNRRASLLDTISSGPAYNKTTDKEYRKLAFFFNSSADIDSYWYNAYGICLSTKLNTKQGGQLVTIFDPQSRPELAKALTPKTPEAAIEDDNGEIPGDKRGAAGFDSSLWSHIAKNWFWASKKPITDKPVSMGLRKEKLEKVLPKNLSYNELHTISHANKVYLHKTAKESKEPKPKLRKYVHVPLKPSKTVQKITRKIPFRVKTAKRQYHDHLDKMILKRIGVNVRVRWKEEEDRVLLLCMAACRFLNPRHPRKQIVSYMIIRDVLHRACAESWNKTSRAIQRRMKTYLVPRYHYIGDNVPQLLEIKPISDYYSALVNNLKKPRNADENVVKYTEGELTQAFVILMAYLLKHPEDAEKVLQGKSINIDYLSEDRLAFTENNFVVTGTTPPKYVDAKTEDDIRKNILKSVIHSSLGCKNKPGWTFQLFKIYQKYSDNLICEALTELKRSQAISFKKLIKKKAKNRWHTPFQLSNTYIFSRWATFTLTTAVEAYKTFLNLKGNNKFLNFSQETIESKKYGQLLGLNEFCSFWEGVHFKFYLPRTTVILNPHIKDHSEVIEELALRWEAKLKKVFQDNTDTELEQDNDTENRSKSQDFASTSSSRENASTSEDNPKYSNNFNDNQNNPLDLTVEAGDSETIDRLKHWVTDCMEAERERRSPSPEFINLEEFGTEEMEKSEGKASEVEEQESYGYEEVDKLSYYNLRKMITKEQIPSLEEIKEGMLKYTSSTEDRVIPHITDLSSLLNKEFADSNLDEDKLNRLKNHFITQYAVLEDLTLDGVEQLEDYFVVEYIESNLRNRRLWKRITDDLMIKKPKSMAEIQEILAGQKGSERDFRLAEELIDFVSEKKSLGASAAQIKENFRHLEGNCSLETILETLTDNGIFLRVGICSLTFVHYEHQSLWLVETFTLSNDEHRCLQEKASSQSNVRENIDKQLGEKPLINISIMPWVKVDGTLNEENLKSWLCSVLSHCLDHPKITFMKLSEKFCYLKPVDLYYLLEILKEMGCIELYAYEDNKQDIFSSWEYVEERNATLLDDFESVHILPNNVSMTCMGSFFYQNNLI